MDDAYFEELDHQDIERIEEENEAAPGPGIFLTLLWYIWRIGDNGGQGYILSRYRCIYLH